MLKKLALFGAFFVCCGIALASNPARFDLPVVTTTPAQVPPGALPNLLAVTNATVSICGYPATVVNGMCTNTITTYTDSTLSTACPSTAQMTAPGTSVCISTTGLQGTFGFWYNAATQTHMTYTLQTSWGTYGPYDIDPGAAGSGNGTVTTYSAGNAAPLFNTSVANPTTTPALSFSLNAFAAHSFYGNNGASTATPAVSLLGVSDWSPNAFALGAGTAQAQTATLNPPATALTAGLEVRWLPVAANTAAGPTLNVNGLGARVITKVGTSALAANDLTTMAVADVIFDGTYFQLQDPQTNAAGASGAVLLSPPAANQTINYNTSGATTLTVTNPNAGSGATSGYTASNGADFFSLELAGSGTALPGAASFISSNATAPLSFETGGGPILFNAPNTNVSGALNYASDTGSANAYVVAPPSCVSATHAGTTINFEAANASTGASTLVYCTGSPVTLYKNGSTALTTGDILAGAQYSARFDGTNWQLLNSSLTGSSLPSGTGVVKVTSGTGALASPITDYQVPVAVSLANYSASNLPVTFGNVTNSSNSITVQNASAAGWATGMGAFIPAVSTSATYPATGLTCPYVAVSGNTLTCFQANGTTPINATWTTTGFNLPVYHYNMTNGAITSGTNSLVVTSAATFSTGQGIMVRGAGTSGADLICPVISVSGTTITLFQANGSTACNAGTTVTTGQVFHDDTNALSLALAAAQVLPGYSLRIPAGTYFLSSGSNIVNPMTVYGDGLYQSAFIVTEDGLNAISINAGGVTWKDTGLFMSESITPTSGNLMELCNIAATSECFNDNILRNMFYWGWNQFAVYNKGIQDSFSYNTLHSPDNAAIYVDNPPGYGDMNFDGNQAQNCNGGCTTGTYGLLVDAADANAFNSDKFNAFIHNIWITGQLGNVDHIRFNNVSFEDFTTSTGSAVQSLNSHLVIGIEFNGGETEDHLFIGNNVSGTQITGLRFFQSAGGVSADLDIAGQSTSVVGGSFQSCVGDCIRLESTATNTTVAGSTFNTGTGWGINDLTGLGTGGPSVAQGNTFSSMASGNSNMPNYQEVDQFAGTAGTALTSHVADTGQTWNFWTANGGTNSATLNGSGAFVLTPAVSAAYYSSLVPSSPNYTVSMNCVLNAGSGQYCAVFGRMVTGAVTDYQINLTTTAMTLYRVVAGSATTLGTYTHSFTVGTPYSFALIMNGSQISANLNGSQVIAPVTDTAITAAGWAGVSVAGAALDVGSDFKVSNNSGLITPLATQEYVQDVASQDLPLTGGTLTGTTGLAATQPATSSANVNSPNMQFIGNYWNGSASATDTWSCDDNLSSWSGSPTNAQSILDCTHSGSPGGAYFRVPSLLTTSLSTAGGQSSADFVAYQTSLATSGANYNSPGFDWHASYWTGSVSNTDEWTSGDVLGAGTNPTTTWTLTHYSGTSGLAAVSFGSMPVTAGSFTTSGSTPKIATGTASNTDVAGQLTLSSGTATYTFANTYTSAPICVATDTTTASAVKVGVTTTVLTLTGTSADVLNYICIGRN